MTKLINAAANYVDESLEGLCSAYPGFSKGGSTGRVIACAEGPVAARVGVVTGG